MLLGCTLKAFVDVFVPGDLDTGHVTRLQEVEVSCGQGPFDVLGQAVVMQHDGATEFAQCARLLGAQAGLGLLLDRHRYSLRTATGGTLDAHRLGGDGGALDVQCAAIESELVRGYLTRYHRFAKAPAAVDDELVDPAIARVDGEHHAGHFRLDHALHDHREQRVHVIETTVLPVGDSACGPQRRPALLHCFKDRACTTDVEIGIVHAGE